MSAIVILCFLGASCGSDDPDTADTTPTTRRGHHRYPVVDGDVTVFAAASLTAAFTDIGDAFMAANPDAERRVELRRVVGPRRPDRRRSPGRRVRLGRPEQHDQGDRCRPERVRAGGVRDEHRRDHRRSRQPGGHHRGGGPRRPGPDRRPMRARGAVRQVRGADLRERRRHGDSEVARGQRQGGRHQGDVG